MYKICTVKILEKPQNLLSVNIYTFVLWMLWEQGLLQIITKPFIGYNKD